MRTVRVVCLAGAALTAFWIQAAAQSQSTARAKPMNTTLTAVAGIKVGHHTLANAPTGCTVILAEAGATAGVDVRGMAPASAETDLLNPVNLVQQVHAITLSGRSAFGLDARSGVMRYLEERRIGFPFGQAFVPIVPAASLFDLGVGDPLIRPTADCGYEAARAADTLPVKEGSVGAGAGATLGKSQGIGRAMKSGVGSAAITTANGLVVAALVVVNAFGDVIDPATGRVVAGVRTTDGRGFEDARRLMRSGAIRFESSGSGNTTLGVVATNAGLTKTAATRVAQMAHDGYARAISPVHTPVDGDLIFALATNSYSGPADVGVIGALAAEAMADAIVRAARQATGLKGFPALGDLK
jgi:L-aminopeptidase/D-esterase-like protein